ncbi:MAG: hypothetical protein R3C30_00240 [Hyphomonadaceae bacterium]
MRRFLNWLTGPAGLVIALILIALKLIALGEKEGWQLYLNDAARNVTQIQIGQWPAVLVILLEGVVAGAAVSIVYSYTINHVSQTVQNIWQRLEPMTPAPETVLVDPETRSWVSGLTGRDLREAQQKILDQANSINHLTTEVQRLGAQLTSVTTARDNLAVQLGAVEQWFERFEKLANETKEFRKSLRP